MNSSCCTAPAVADIATFPSVRPLESVRYGTLPPLTANSALGSDGSGQRRLSIGAWSGSTSEVPKQIKSPSMCDSDDSSHDDAAAANDRSMSSSDDGSSESVTLWSSEQQGGHAHLHFLAEPLECVVNSDARRLMLQTIAASNAANQRRYAISQYQHCIDRRHAISHRSSE
eukprot:6184301-Pleurochrysis_carterae.AAC.1